MKKIKKKDLLHRSTLEFLDKTSTTHKKITGNDIKEDSSSSTLIKLFEILLSDIISYRKKLLVWGNDEDLHQFRIVCRKLIVLMEEFKFLYGDDSILENRKGLKNFISISNDKRDMDVLISELSIMEVSHCQDVLYLLKERVEKKIIIEHDKIMDYLKSEACINVLVACENYIADMNRTYISIYGKYSIEVLSKYVIFQRFLKIKKRIKLLAPKHDASETLHKLRIEYKKLRYLVESFRYLYREKEIKKLLKEIKKLQNVLGLFHDSYQQKIIFETMLETETNERVQSFIKDRLLSNLKTYQKKEILEIQKLLKGFLKKEEAYRMLFA